MPAFKASYVAIINDNLNKMFELRKSIAHFNLTHEEYYANFVPAEARDIFRAVAPYHGAYAGSGTFQIDGSEVNMYVMDSVNGLPPIVKKLSLQPDASPEFIARLEHWHTHGGNVYKDFGRVRAVITYLSDNMGRAALRYYWPSIIAILGWQQNGKALAEELATRSEPSKLPLLRPGYRAMLRQAAETISTVQLIDKTATPRHGEAYILVAPSYSKRFSENGITFSSFTG